MNEQEFLATLIYTPEIEALPQSALLHGEVPFVLLPHVAQRRSIYAGDALSSRLTAIRNLRKMFSRMEHSQAQGNLSRLGDTGSAHRGRGAAAEADRRAVENCQFTEAKPALA